MPTIDFTIILPGKLASFSGEIFDQTGFATKKISGEQATMFNVFMDEEVLKFECDGVKCEINHSSQMGRILRGFCHENEGRLGSITCIIS
ncbi:MAG: hypothetical protein UT03_C0060G0005 [Candidatus Moranbacteria bacterium GW2011_GWD2_38_7]|nr:MAG: hypothetical protein US82_C0028G0010 [Parcubacteria group bacterium GW2011_GWC1_38_22]KKQ79375.1 MAG: hypothetical protein UT03_C0060G0005 [Candidatus Moranbacteria bacterium GW2011_GWD2_38_7]